MIAIPSAVAFTGIFAKINAPLDAIVLWCLSWHTTQRIVADHARYGWLRSGALILATWGSTRFHQAQLSKADFTGARLNATDFTEATLTGTCFRQAQFLDYAHVGTTLLRQPKARQLLVSGEGRGQDYRGCYLRGAYLAEAVLLGADFTDADLSQADLTGAHLRGAVFIRTQAVGTCFCSAQMTASCIEAWNINSSTQLAGVDCDYVYLLDGQRERRPSQGDFEPGDFTKLFQDVLHTVDLIFRQGLDMSAFMRAFQQVQRRGEDLAIRSIENKGDGVVVVKVEVPEDAPKPQIQAALTQEYDQALQQIEARYQAALAAKDEQISLYRQHQSELSKLTQLLTQPSVRQPLSGKRVVLKLGHKEALGIPVTLQLGDEGAQPQMETTGWLPSADSLLQAQQRWQMAYRQVYQHATRIDAPAVQLTNVSYRELFEHCQEVHGDLLCQINSWLNSEQFRPVRDTLLAALDPVDSIRFVLQTDSMPIRAMPLHLWEWFDRYIHAELVLSEPIYRQGAAASTASGQVRILAILGDSRGLDVARDRRLLEQLPDVALTCLVEPVRSQLNDSLWEQPWDILFFAGHSTCTNSQQQLRINATESLSLSDLNYGLRQAIQRGLKLAIFNACDGLQLIENLSADLSLPPTIVMRHPVPDAVAQAFLKHFLSAFSQGAPLHQAVREARERLQGIESQFPFATWLPVLCQNPAGLPLTWEAVKSGRDTI
ncbi:MAG: CHAT domain-containing protein [Phormidesmis sp. RL_2_1]|nr:CHAT domain-containing protein [Phormidesmis sp. RL_2_1]